MPKRRLKSRGNLPGAASTATYEALTLFTLLSREDQVAFVLNKLKRDLEALAPGTERANYNKIILLIEKSSNAKSRPEEIVEVPVVEETPAVKISEKTPVPISPKSTVTTWADLLKKGNKPSTIEFSSPVKSPEPTFAVVEAPGKGAAPSTTTSLMRTSDPSLEYELDKLAKTALDRYKKLPMAESCPYIRIASINNKGTTEKIVILGTACGYMIPDNAETYSKLYCAVNGQVPNRKNTDLLYTTPGRRNFIVNSSIPAHGYAKSPEERWIRLLRYQDGMIFKYWRSIKNSSIEEKRYFQIVDNRVTEITSTTYAALELSKIPKTTIESLV